MTSAPASFVELLDRAVREPGIISQAYSAFHGYSVGNQILAWLQCEQRGIQPGPIATFVGWKEKGRYVRKGEKAIVLCQPITVKRRTKESEPAADPDQPEVFTRFMFRARWFVLAQTEGAAVDREPLPAWEAARALQTLGITEEPFAMLDGNCQGYARERTISVSPVAAHPHKTRFHEVAHVVLGHTAETAEGLSDEERTPRSLREVEAEAVALLCLEALGLPGAEYARGYVQHWNQERGSEPIPERSAQRILKAADQILKAGAPAAAAGVEVAA
jgi:antirestriction protein ArdC